MDNQPSDDGQLRELALFTGAGGGILGGTLLGWRTICAVEINPYAASVLVKRQNDGILAPFPIWDDIRTFDGTPWRGLVDIVSGGFPCQDISFAGTGKGISGERSGLWGDMARIIGEVRPLFVFVENSPAIATRGLGVVLGDLSTLGYAAEWDVFSACALGAPQTRERMFILAYPNEEYGAQRIRIYAEYAQKVQPKCFESVRKDWLQTVTGNARGADGLADDVDRLEAVGNGQVPIVAAKAFCELLRASLQ